MKTDSLFPRVSVLVAFVAASVALASGQSYYDDDIYYDASKAPKKEVKQSKKANTSSSQTSTQLYYDGAQYVPWNNVGNYQSADTYQVEGTSTRDVDEYNRRYTTVQQTNEPDSITLQQFQEMSNTRKLARFQSSEVAAQAYDDYDSNDTEYYAANSYGYNQPTTTINLNVVGGYGYPYYSYPYYGYYYGSPWYWNHWGYDPWWGPSWSWNWGWGYPSWSWGWGGPAWGPGWGPSWGGEWHVHPNYTSSGAFAPNTTRRPGGNSYRNGASGSGTTYRYGNYSSGNRTGNAVNRTQTGVSTNRPGYRQPIGTPTHNNSGVTNGGTRGRNVSGNNNNNYNNNQNTYRHNTPNSNYNRGNYGSGTRGSSSGSFGGNRGGFSGGNRSTGGGGHRGR